MNLVEISCEVNLFLLIKGGVYYVIMYFLPPYFEIFLYLEPKIYCQPI